MSDHSVSDDGEHDVSFSGAKRSLDLADESTVVQAEVPDYWLYFAKPEERLHFKPSDHGMILVGQQRFDDATADYYQLERLHIGVFSGTLQGVGFPLPFYNFMHAIRPKALIMCGICAGLGDVKPGDVCIGESSMVLQGKISDLSMTSLVLEKVVPASATDGAGNFWRAIDSERSTLGFGVHRGTYIQAPFVMAYDLNYLTGLLKPGDRKLVALDMESWFYFNVQSFLGQPLILPVVKGISDVGSGKSDHFHNDAIKNSVRIALHILRQVAMHQALSPIRTQGNSITNSRLTSKRRKVCSSSDTPVLCEVSRDDAVKALTDAGLADELLQAAIVTLDNVLKKVKYDKLGLKNFKIHHVHFSLEAKGILAKLIGKEVSDF